MSNSKPKFELPDPETQKRIYKLWSQGKDWCWYCKKTRFKSEMLGSICRSCQNKQANKPAK